MSIFHLPVRLIGLKNIPAVPLVLDQIPGTLFKLSERQSQVKPAKWGLTNSYKIGQTSATAHSFMYGTDAPATSPLRDAAGSLAEALKNDAAKVLESLYHEAPSSSASAAPADSLTSLSLDDPSQFSMSWTTFNNIARNAQPLLSQWSATLTDVDTATAQFWPNIARFGLAYNLLLPQKLSGAKLTAARSAFQSTWDASLDGLAAAGALYVIDLSIFNTLEPQQVHGFTRFTPATITLLQQDPVTKNLLPVSIKVSGYQGAGSQYFTRANSTPSAWLYALQAAKTSVTVYGIWIGHVYHWHVVTAAMQMTMYNNLSSTHPLYQLLAPQSNYLMAFDNVLLLLWSSIAPPTSVSSSLQFLKLSNTFATGRNYFDDDPPNTIAQLGLQEADFTVSQPWDKYPIVPQFLQIWNATADYVNAFVNATYANDQAVQNDPPLQAWMKAAGDSDGGNVQGLPAMTGKAALAQTLTSLIYRITMHGCSRLSPIANPGLTFVANFPPCLQNATIPAPGDTIDSKALLAYLPKTGTIGEMITFYYIFGFSSPYEPFIPLAGIDTGLFFSGGASDPRNQALVAYRNAVLPLMNSIFGADSTLVSQWPLNIET